MESLEAVLVFVVPLLSVIPFYALGFLTEVSGHYIIYSIYIACSVLLTRYNGRSLAEIGLTHKGLLPSLGYSAILVAAAFLRSLIFADLKISPDANSWANVAYGLFYWMFGGLGQETLFRGLILFSLQRWKGWKIALVISSMLFGLMHVRQGVTGVMGTILIGGYWGWVALKTRNMIGTTIAHGFYNFIFTFLFVT
ncbi:MAG: type II CAAX endopeptidase family protein [Thermoproteota archaeon]|nr:type II CAAX endopeptidase family protein [Thermoproteota archaeon]